MQDFETELLNATRNEAISNDKVVGNIDAILELLQSPIHDYNAINLKINTLATEAIDSHKS